MKKPFIEIDSDHFVLMPFDVLPPSEYKPPVNFPDCCPFHKGVFEHAEKFFLSFPNCCEEHKKLPSKSWFVKELYQGLPMKLLNLLSYTEHQIDKKLLASDWDDDIADYIELCVSSLGTPAIGVHVYLGALQDYFKTDKIPKAKQERLTEIVQKYFEPRADAERIDLNSLYDAYRKWLNIFPFQISHFQGLKEKYSKILPIISEKPKVNRYTKIAKAKIFTKKQLIESLVTTTKDLLASVDSSGAKEALPSEVEAKRLELLNERHRIRQSSLLIGLNNEETKYLKTIKQWLKNEQRYFADVAELFRDKRPNPSDGVVKLELPPIANEDLFEDFVCDLYNSIYPSGLFHRFGKRGSNQKGIDLLSTVEKIAIQCKKKNVRRKNLISELKFEFENDIKKVLKLNVELKVLIFASTFADNSILSEYLQELHQKFDLKFAVMYIGWDTLSACAQREPQIMQRYFSL